MNWHIKLDNFPEFLREWHEYFYVFSITNHGLVPRKLA